jgi:hypothetical protein
MNTMNLKQTNGGHILLTNQSYHQLLVFSNNLKYRKCSVKILKGYMKVFGIKGYSKLKKQQLKEYLLEMYKNEIEIRKKMNMKCIIKFFRKITKTNNYYSFNSIKPSNIIKETGACNDYITVDNYRQIIKKEYINKQIGDQLYKDCRELLVGFLIS